MSGVPYTLIQELLEFQKPLRFVVFHVEIIPCFVFSLPFVLGNATQNGENHYIIIRALPLTLGVPCLEIVRLLKLI